MEGHSTNWQDRQVEDEDYEDAFEDEEEEKLFRLFKSEVLKGIRGKLRLTNKELAEVLGVGMGRLKKWTEGEEEIPFWAEKILYILLDMRRRGK